MDTLRLGRLLRMVRLRRNWRQVDVAARAHLSAAAVGRHENGRVLSLRALESHAAVFGLRLELRLLGRAGDIGRLADEDHAALVGGLRLGCAHPESFADWPPRPLSLRTVTRAGRSLSWIPAQRAGRETWLATSQRVRRPRGGR